MLAYKNLFLEYEEAVNRREVFEWKCYLLITFISKMMLTFNNRCSSNILAKLKKKQQKNSLGLIIKKIDFVIWFCYFEASFFFPFLYDFLAWLFLRYSFNRNM